MITRAFVNAGVPAYPPSQQIIDSQTPDDTINQILAQSQQNAVDAATAAAAAQAPDLFTLPSLPKLPDLPKLPSVNWLLIGGVAVAAVFVFGFLGGRR